jgi:hypothetical protein
MEIPSKSRTRVVVLALYKNDSVLVRRDNINTLWSVPDSHLHWPISKAKMSPLKTANFLLKDSLIGLLENEICEKPINRQKLPTGGFFYIKKFLQNDYLNKTVDQCLKVRKHMKIKNEETELHLISDIANPNSHGKYSHGTIETVRAYLINQPSLL